MVRLYQLLIITVISLVMTHPSYAYGFYTIKMRNGRQFTTSQYWEDGGRIMFYVYNGVMGLKKGFVETISRRQTNQSKEIVVPNSYGQIINKQEKMEKNKNDMLSVKADQKKTEKRSDEYIDTFKSIKNDFTNVHMMTTDEIYDFSSKLSAFKKKMIKDDVVRLYSEMFTELYVIGDEMEAILKARGQ